ncbi:hypothetical protein AMECASPLE_021168 [Ameca splendens]|uniref:Uncharacterized protein n=1 Tax=Ameca splendens TaxID=208324 RepID=A0ABV0YQX4_9TELE
MKPHDSAFYFNNKTTPANLIPLLKQLSVPLGLVLSAHLHDELARNTNLQQQLNVKQQNTGFSLPRCSLLQKEKEKASRSLKLFCFNYKYVCFSPCSGIWVVCSFS